MDINDCQRAVEACKKLEKINVFLKYIENRNADTFAVCLLHTGRGEETLQVQIPWDVVREAAQAQAQKYVDILNTLRIDIGKEV
jgi:hypothetical protein